jgi:hypothetical protein
MSGQALFMPIPDDSLRYRETGSLVTPDGKTFQFERGYIYQPRPKGFRVLFDETPPRLFHDVDLKEQGAHLVADAFHACSPDTYTSTYRFDPSGSFRVVHDVTGPRKSYSITTDYTRLTTSLSDPSK